MKFKKIIAILIIIISILIFLRLPEFTVAQTYNVYEIVSPEDYRVYQTSINANELGWFWRNYLNFTLVKNDTSCRIFITNIDGFNEFNLTKNVNNISQQNILSFITDYSAKDNVVRKSQLFDDNEIGYSTIFVIIYNNYITDASWHVTIYPYSIYIPWWSAPSIPLFIIIFSICIIGIFIHQVLRKKKLKKRVEKSKLN